MDKDELIISFFYDVQKICDYCVGLINSRWIKEKVQNDLDQIINHYQAQDRMFDFVKLEVMINNNETLDIAISISNPYYEEKFNQHLQAYKLLNKLR